MDSSSPSPRRLLWGCALTFFSALVILGWGLSSQRVAATYSDPVAHIRAQDESQYVHASLEIANHGGWLTPQFLGRFYLLKPPLLIWATGISLRIFGINPVAIRLPALFMGIVACCVVFLWTAQARSLTAGVLASGLLLLNPLWGLLSRLCYTDTLAASFSALALWMTAMDPSLERRRTRLLFGLFAGLAVLDKGIAGLIPCLALVLFACLSRPGMLRVAESLAVAALVAAPWHLYQLLVHREWFLAEYVQTQIVASGVFGTEAGIFNRPAFFYVERLFQLDPFLSVLALIAIGRVIQVLRKSNNPSTLLAICWMIVACAALALFQVRNLPYLALALPPLTLMVGLCSGAWVEKLGLPRLAGLLALLFVVITAVTNQTWSLRAVSVPLSGADNMRLYAEMQRPTELIDVSTDDEYYSSTLPLPKVRYIYLDPTGSVARSAPHNAYLGITLTSRQFLDLSRIEPEFEARLREWGLDSAKPVGTTITVNAISDLAEVIAQRPQSDFYLPGAWVPAESVWKHTHRMQQVSGGRVFLLSVTVEGRPGSRIHLPGW